MLRRVLHRSYTAAGLRDAAAWTAAPGTASERAFNRDLLLIPEVRARRRWVNARGESAPAAASPTTIATIIPAVDITDASRTILPDDGVPTYIFKTDDSVNDSSMEGVEYSTTPELLQPLQQSPGGRRTVSDLLAEMQVRGQQAQRDRMLRQDMPSDGNMFDGDGLVSSSNGSGGEIPANLSSIGATLGREPGRTALNLLTLLGLGTGRREEAGPFLTARRCERAWNV